MEKLLDLLEDRIQAVILLVIIILLAGSAAIAFYGEIKRQNDCSRCLETQNYNQAACNQICQNR